MKLQTISPMLPRRALAILAALIATLTFSGCDLIDAITKLVTDAKGNRSVSFLVLEPWKLEIDENERIRRSIGFDNETAGVKASIGNGVLSAADGRSWRVISCDRDAVTNFYSELAKRANGDLKGYVRSELAGVRNNSAFRDCDTVIYMYVGDDPNGTGFLKVFAFGYDIVENHFEYVKRTIDTRDQSSLRFKEEMGELTKGLCEKLYR